MYWCYGSTCSFSVWICEYSLSCWHWSSHPTVSWIYSERISTLDNRSQTKVQSNSFVHRRGSHKFIYFFRRSWYHKVLRFSNIYSSSLQNYICSYYILVSARFESPWHACFFFYHGPLDVELYFSYLTLATLATASGHCRWTIYGKLQISYSYFKW